MTLAEAKKAHELYKDRKVGTTLKDTAISWITKKRDAPFFLYLATTNIHHPFTPAQRFVGTSEAGRYGDFIQELDWMVGEILEALDRAGLTENTLVILTSDNGGMLNQGGQDARKVGHKQNGELLGFKFDAWEGGHRIPFIIKWPGKIPAGSKSDQLIGNIDLMASLAALVSVKLQDEDGPDSYNVLPALLGTSDRQIREHMVISPFLEANLALRKDNWMYISGQGGGGFGGRAVGDHDLGGPPALQFASEKNSDIENGVFKADAPSAQLYNLSNDLSESQNVIEEFPDVAESMARKLSAILDSSKSSVKHE